MGNKMRQGQVITARCEIISNSKNIVPILVIFPQRRGTITRLLLVDLRRKTA